MRARPAFLTALAVPLVLGLLVTATAEILSALHLLGSRTAWELCWAATAVVVAIAIPRFHRRFRDDGSGPEMPGLSTSSVAIVGAILLLTLLVAVVTPPNNWDSMTYHNARVMEWWDHGELTYWYTTIDRQLRMPPLASYFKLALFGLTGSDVLFNLVQWGFFVASILAALLLAAILAPGGRASSIAAVLVATLPMAILQSTSTQNDLVVAGYWLAGAVFFIRAFDENTSAPSLEFLLGCAAVGLSWLSKGTGLVFAGPMLAVALGAALRRAGRSTGPARSKWLRTAALGAALALLVNAGPWSRNQTWFGSPMGGSIEVVRPLTYLDAGLSGGLKLVASQLIRSSALQLDSLRFVGLSSDRLIRIVERVHRWMGATTDAPALAFLSVKFSSIRSQFLTDESTAGCTWHFLLACGTSIVVCLNRRMRAQRLLLWAIGLGWVSWLGLCVSVRWMPWNQRLQLPVLMWLMVPAACTLSTAEPPRWLRNAGGAFLLFAALPALFFNTTRPLGPWALLPARLRETLQPGQPYEMTSILSTTRWHNYFRGQPPVRPAVERVIGALPEVCGRRSVVGLRIGGDSWEYALWVGARHFGRDVRFRHVAQGLRPADVCAVIQSDCGAGEAFCLEPDLARE
jgi:hypothetical protein